MTEQHQRLCIRAGFVVVPILGEQLADLLRRPMRHRPEPLMLRWVAC